MNAIAGPDVYWTGPTVLGGAWICKGCTRGWEQLQISDLTEQTVGQFVQGSTAINRQHLKCLVSDQRQ